MILVHAALTLAAATLVPGPEAAARSPVPPVAQAEPGRIIAGFRSAHFRMTPGEVRRAIATDFPGLAIADRLQPTEGTRVLQLTVPSLDPGPGPAVISYVFGATSRTLALVSVSWSTKADATPDDRQAIAVAALRLSTFLQSATQPKTVIAPKVIRPGAVSLYGALDDRGAGIELIATGVAFSASGVVAPPPTGPASLRLSYMANPANPDVRPASSPRRQPR